MGVRDRLYSLVMDENEVKLLFEYADYDLKTFTDKFTENIPLNTIKSIVYQILCGLRYLHMNRYIHRDIKPQVGSDYSHLTQEHPYRQEEQRQDCRFRSGAQFRLPTSPLHARRTPRSISSP